MEKFQRILELCEPEVDADEVRKRREQMERDDNLCKGEKRKKEIRP